MISLLGRTGAKVQRTLNRRMRNILRIEEERDVKREREGTPGLTGTLARPGVKHHNHS